MIDSDAWFEAEFGTAKVMAILRGFGPEKSLELATQAWSLGVRVVEVPIQSATDVEALRRVARAGAERGVSVGAGTIIRVDQLEVAKQAGAAFTVSPGFDEAVIRASLDAGLPTMPGVATASEVHRAMTFGLHWLKAFPAKQLGPGWIKSMHGPFPDAILVATGGIDIENAPAFLDAGCRIVSLGSSLADQNQVDRLAELSRE